MIEQIEDADLQPRNTLRLPGRARRLALIDGAQDLREVCAQARSAGMPVRVLGEGSNTVVAASQVDVQLVCFRSGGWRILRETGNEVLVEADAGMNWHALVMATVEAGLRGIENLALIPGSVGAAPVQNIGAYGVELADVLHEVDVLDMRDGAERTLAARDCRLAYRDSLFKHPDGNALAILRVRLRLARGGEARLGYRDLQQAWEQDGCPLPTPRWVADTVCAIRRRKLPDPSVLGNAGSFFRNPVVDAAQLNALRERHPDIVAYVQADGRAKLAAAWLIERAGWKGRRLGEVGVHAQHALVLVNHGGGTGAQLLGLAQRIVADVQVMFGVTLEMEPVVLGETATR